MTVPAPAREGVEVRRLPSGLTLVTRTVSDSAVAAAQLWFDVGAADEAPEEAGMAHFVEHALFKGTERRGVGESAAEIEGRGGDLNAWTSWDETCFHATVESGAVPEALDVLLDLASCARMDPEELAREREVVLDEIRTYDDDPDSVAADAAQQHLFRGHPYGRPIIGWPRTVSSFQAPDVVRFWRRHYHPARATLAVVGPVGADDVEALIRPALARWSTGEPRGAATPAEPSRQGGLVLVDRAFATAVAHLVWPGPPTLHPDLPALDVLQMALYAGASSRLVSLLELDRGVASQIRPVSHTLLGAGVLGVGFQCGETEEALALALEALAESAERGLPRSEVVRAREGILADLLFSQETVEGKAAELVHWTARSGDPRGDLAYRAAVAAVTPEDVARVARAWLRPEQAQVVVVDKKVSRARLRKAVERPLARPVPAGRPSPPRRGEAARFELGAAPLAVLPDRGELAAVEVTALGGQLAERSATAGATGAWSRLVTRGAGPWDARTFAERCDSSGVALEASGDRSQQSIHLTCPADELPVALELLGEVLTDPFLDPQDWENVREELLDDLDAWRDDGASVAYDQLYGALWPGHPWELHPLGTPASIRRLQPDRLRRFHRSTLAQDNVAIGVAGGVDPERVRDLLAPWVARLPRRSRVPAPPAPGPVRPAGRAEGGFSQAHLLAGVRGVAADDPDRTALSVAARLLDSSSGRLFLALRERRGLAYGVWARSDAARGGGVFSAGLATDPGRLEEAREALLAELRLLVDPGPDEAELARAKRLIRGLTAMRSERVSARAADLARSLRHGVPYGLEGLDQRLAAVTPNRLRNVLERVLVDPVVVEVLPMEA